MASCLLLSTVIRIDMFQICPRGVYGNDTDLTTPQCSAYCPVGKYGDMPGLISDEDCPLVFSL